MAGGCWECFLEWSILGVPAVVHFCRKRCLRPLCACVLSVVLICWIYFWWRSRGARCHAKIWGILFLLGEKFYFWFRDCFTKVVRGVSPSFSSRCVPVWGGRIEPGGRFLFYVFVNFCFAVLLADPFGVAVVWESIYSKFTSAESFRRHRSNLTKNESVIVVRYYSSVFAALARRCTREGRIPHCTRWTCVSSKLVANRPII